MQLELTFIVDQVDNITKIPRRESNILITILLFEEQVKIMQNIMITRLWILSVFSLFLFGEQVNYAGAFVQTTLPPSENIRSSRGTVLPEPLCFGSRRRTTSNNRNNKQSTELSFMGSDGGILGIGTPELFTIVLIGYFVLGPSDLYKLVKEIGKTIQNFQSFATEATASLENNMESQLQLEEIRKVQRELDDAFSFRRSINVEADSDPFAVNAQSPRGQDDITAPSINESEYDLSTTATTGAAVAPKKKMRRVKRKKKVAVEPLVASEISYEPVEVEKNAPIGTTTFNQQLVNDIPSELKMDDELLQAENKAMESILNGGNDDLKAEEIDTSSLAAQIREERIERLERAEAQQPESNDSTSSSGEQSRFQQQMTGDWNSQILANNDKLEPLGEVMNLLAVLEEEKNAADKRLQEEFKSREVNEEKFYLEKRKVLEEAAAGIQAQAYAGNIPTETP